VIDKPLDLIDNELQDGLVGVENRLDDLPHEFDGLLDAINGDGHHLRGQLDRPE
jgi:hypothetical protein